MDEIYKLALQRGYARGYRARVMDEKRVVSAKAAAQEKSFKAEQDTIDDVRTSKWA